MSAGYGSDCEFVAPRIEALLLGRDMPAGPVGMPLHLLERDFVTAMLDEVDELLPELAVRDRLLRSRRGPGVRIPYGPNER